MKLLEKNKIIALKNQERAVEVNEGYKLAKKVDSLRQTYADEQKNLINFRNETTRKVKEEIAVVFKQRDDLKEEVYSLMEEKKELLIPLDEQWDKVHKKEDELIQYANSLSEKTQLLQEDKNYLEVEQQKIKEERKRIDAERKATIAGLSEAEDKKDKAQIILLRAEETEKNKLNAISEKEKLLSVRESNISYLEVDIQNKNESIEKEKQFISQEKIRLASMRNTLERAIKKYK